MSFEEFEQYAKSFNVIPVWKSLLADTLTPVSVYLRLREDGAASFLFESVEGGEHFGRYSFIGLHPHTIISTSGGSSTIAGGGKRTTSETSTFDLLASIIKQFRQPSIPALPRYSCGLVGYLGYDAVRLLERLPSPPPNTIGFEDSMFGLFTSIVAFDHLKHQMLIISNVIVDPSRELLTQYNDALSTLESIERRILSPNGSAHLFSPDAGGVRTEMSREQYETLVRKAKEHIVEGDIFQVVLSQRFSQKFEGDSFNVYRALRIINPSPYLYYLNFPGCQVIGSSPEILVRMDGDSAEVYPIAGTRPRGGSVEEDAANEQDLLHDEKERAEHVMLVDLGRNDLGRVCAPGSVLVDEFMFPVRYSHVMHLASRVTGSVDPALGCLDVLKAVFPAGTVSGAPKIRAMEIIDSLEPSRRCVYAGGVGYLDFAGRMDFCIAIRTLFAKDGVLHYQAGAGIVADSDPSREYQETLNKAGALKDAIALAERIR